MPAHDIIDNRNEKLVHHINRILASSESDKFVVGTHAPMGHHKTMKPAFRGTPSPLSPPVKGGEHMSAFLPKLGAEI